MSGTVLTIAHRGFRGIAPENTILAAQRAFEAGCAWWELDVAASADGELVVIHDDSLARTTDAARRFPSRSPWCVYDFSLAELGELDAGSFYAETDPFRQIQAGRVGALELEHFRALRIPTLRECLEFTRARGKCVNVEIKDARGRACDPWIVERTVELIRSLGMERNVLLSSFNHDYLRRARRMAPKLALGVLTEGKSPPGILSLLKELGARSYNPELGPLDEATVREVRASGFDVFVWTVNEKSDMRRLIAWGVNGMFTDFPDRLFEVLAEL